MKTDYSKTIEDIRKFTMGAVSESRYAHSVRTAQTCKKLCSLYGLDPERGYLAGIAHDMCKKMDDDLLISIASRDGIEISQIEQDKPSLLHGRAAAVKIKNDFGVQDKDVIQAIANHTFGGKNLCDLAKILYVADKIEPGREQVTPEYYERLFALSLNNLVLTVVNESIEYLTKKGKKISNTTLEFVAELKELVKKES